ncbi:uncharacterized protein N0V89_012040 [Didymosphaeria variabile]|uniref:Uncharacterized protein n=1 Tax=Didymosphaeria variabile TaxID=1932322 RepID=A0A9W9C6B3_9PLEO|nr:uncharacterized protein N0V89_012040 [Didymosphaeria variabile]KAJ4345904.1 hypothetical protein N0V89_012040 [Didymosphaeria variabile]
MKIRSESENREGLLRLPRTEDTDAITPIRKDYHIPQNLSPIPEQDSPVKTKDMQRPSSSTSIPAQDSPVKTNGLQRPFSPTPIKASRGHSMGDVDAITPAAKPTRLSTVQEVSSIKPSLTSFPPLPDSPIKGNEDEEKEVKQEAVKELDTDRPQVSHGPGAYNIDTIRGNPRKKFVMERKGLFEAMGTGGQREQDGNAVERSERTREPSSPEFF